MAMKLLPRVLFLSQLIVGIIWPGASARINNKYLRTHHNNHDDGGIEKKELPTRIFPKKLHKHKALERTQSKSTDRPNEIAKQTRIIGGFESIQGRYSYAVSLQNNEDGHFCGGSLIARDVVLSAAHCAGDNYTVVVGRHNLNSQDGQEIAKSMEVPHPDWNPSTTEYDFNLVFLSQPAPSDVDLVILNSDSDTPNQGDSVTVMGWGVTSLANGQKMSNTLRDVEVKVMSNEVCAQSKGWIGNWYDSYQGAIKDSMLCAQDTGEDSCQGDSGGPLVLEGSDGSSDVLVGVVSWGIGCASDTFPGVYARVSSAYDWIKAEVCNRSSDPPPYLQCTQSYAANMNSNKFVFQTAVPPTMSPTILESSDSDTCENFSLDVRTDGYASEISWELEQVKGNKKILIASGPPSNDLYADNTYYQSAAYGCLPPGNYRFTCYDTYGDGIIEPGYYQITLSGYLLALNSDFGYQDSTSFTVGIPEPVKSNFPNGNGKEWTHILEEDFRHGYGIFRAGGKDAFHYSTALSRYGVVRIQGGNGMSSSIYSKKVPISGTSFKRIKVTFSFVGHSMEFNDKFCLDVMMNESPAWVEQKCWHGKGDFDNDVWYDDETFEMKAANIMDSIRIRFRCASNSVHDDILIDSVKMQGLV